MQFQLGKRFGIRPFTLLPALFFIAILVCPGVLPAAGKNIRTILVSAEGLADPDADIYKKNKGLMIDDLRKDARRQVIEKAVGTFVDSSTLVQNFTLIHDRVITQSKGLIKRIVKESSPWKGKDGFMHLLIKAEVYLSDIKSAIEDMSQTERVMLIKERGNPKISVSVTVRDAKRGAGANAERSAIAENVLKERFSRFGYRVWSDQSPGMSQSPAADFRVTSEAKFKALSIKLKASGLVLTKYVLTSWTVKCVDTQTGEEIYFNNQLPRGKGWTDEDRALQDIGRLIAGEFTKDFFEINLMKPSRIFQLQLSGLPDYDTGTLFKKELIGLRSVLNIDFRDYNAEAVSLFEVEFAGARGNFLDIINDTVIKPLNLKFGRPVFKLTAARGDMVKIKFKSNRKVAEIHNTFESTPPASLANASPERIQAVIKNKATFERVAQIYAVVKSHPKGNPLSPSGGLDQVKNF